MANGIKEFGWKTCPYCRSDFDGQCDIVKSDLLGAKEITVRCGSCGTAYTVERVIFWQARKIYSGKPLSQEVTEFLADREKRLMKHIKGKANS